MHPRRCEGKTRSGGRTSERIRSNNKFSQSHALQFLRRQLTSCPVLLPPISMLAPPVVGGAPPLVPLICEAYLSDIKVQPQPMNTHLYIPQFDTATVGTRPVHGSSVSRSVCHGSRHNQSRPLVSGWVALGRDFLVRGGEGQGLGDEVLFTRAQAEDVSIPSVGKELVEPVRDGVRGVRALARHDGPWK
jgi:hypothetical protein